MKVLLLVTAFVLCGATLVNGPTPTALEAFASASDTRIKQEIDVGKLESSDALLKVTALVLVNDGHQVGEMRGVRFVLQNNVGTDVIYLDLAQIDRLRRDLKGLETGRASFEEHGDAAPYRVQGTESCWLPESTARIMCPSVYTFPNGSGLSLHALFSPDFQFPNRSAKELMLLVETSLRALGEALPAIEPAHAGTK